MILKNFKQFVNESNDSDLEVMIKSRDLKISYVDENGDIYYNSSSYDSVAINSKMVNNNKLSIKFDKVDEDFKVQYLDVNTFEGFPNHVGKSLYVSNNDIDSLKYSPNFIGKHFIMQNNHSLISLDHFPEHVGSYIDFSGCSLTSLEGLPENVNDDLHLANNNLQNLKGAPKSVDGSFVLSGNKNLTSLEGFPGVVTGKAILLECENLKSLYGITNRVQKVVTPTHLKTEEDFINNYEMAVLHNKNYWKELLEFVIKNNKTVTSVNWPQDIIDTMPQNVKNLVISQNTVGKFNL